MCMRTCDVHLCTFAHVAVDGFPLCVNFRLRDGPRSMVESTTASVGLALACPN